MFRTELEEALYVSWAIERQHLPEPPHPLTLDCPLIEGCSTGFLTVVLFRHRGLRLSPLSWPRLRFAQCNLRIPVRDPDRVPAVWLLRQLVPGWAVPLGRLVSGLPLEAASLREERDEEDGAVRWEVEAGGRLGLLARPGVAAQGGRWRERMAFLSQRPRAYARQGTELKRLDAQIDHAEPMPMRVAVESADCLARLLPRVPAECWASPVSSFLCSSVRLEVETAPDTAGEVPSRVPATGIPV